MTEQMAGLAELTAYSMNLVSASVCTSLGRQDVLARMNLQCPTGVGRSWQFSDSPVFAGGEPNPCPCDTNPDTHKHYLLEC